MTRQKYEKLHTIVNYNLQSDKIERKKSILQHVSEDFLGKNPFMSISFRDSYKFFPILILFYYFLCFRKFWSEKKLCVQK